MGSDEARESPASNPSGSAAVSEEFTLSPEQRAILGRAWAGRLRMIKIIAVAAPIIGLACYYYGLRAGETFGFVAVFSLVLFAVLELVCVGAYFLSPSRKSTAETIGVRVSGPITSWERGYRGGLDTLQVANGPTLYVPGWSPQEAMELRWGTVEHTKHSRMVLEVRDAEGKVVYHPS